MYLIIRFVPFLSALLFAITFEIWSIRPHWTYYIVGVIVLIVALSVWAITGASFFKKLFWNFFSTPALFAVSSSVFLLLIDNFIVRQMFIVGVSVLVALVLYNIMFFLHREERYQPYALENIYSYMNMVSLFLFYASFYGFSLLLGRQFWIFVPLIFVLTAFLFMRTLWSYKIPWQKSKLYIITIGLIIAQLSFAVSFLPTSFLLNAFILFISYYLTMNFFKDILKDQLQKKSMRLYIIISLMALTVVLATARWE